MNCPKITPVVIIFFAAFVYSMLLLGRGENGNLWGGVFASRNGGYCLSLIVALPTRKTGIHFLNTANRPEPRSWVYLVLAHDHGLWSKALDNCPHMGANGG